MLEVSNSYFGSFFSQPPCSSPQEYNFEILDGFQARSGPNSAQIQEIGPEWAREVRQNLGNPCQMEDNKGAPSAPPPLGFWCISGALLDPDGPRHRGNYGPRENYDRSTATPS